MLQNYAVKSLLCFWFAVLSSFTASFAAPLAARAAEPTAAAAPTPKATEEKSAAEKQAYHLAKLFFAARAAIGERTAFTDDPTSGKHDKAALLDSIRVAYERIANEPLDVAGDARMKVLWESIGLVIDRAMKGDFKDSWKDHPNFPGRLIPARFGSLVTEQFNSLSKEGSLRWTTSDEFLVNPKNKADKWEEAAIKEHFKAGSWQQGAPYFETVKQGGHSVFRYAMPEYFKTACMNCHGGEMGKQMHKGKGAPGSGTFGGILSVQLRQ